MCACVSSLFLFSSFVLFRIVVFYYDYCRVFSCSHKAIERFCDQLVHSVIGSCAAECVMRVHNNNRSRSINDRNNKDSFNVAAAALQLPLLRY